MIPLFKTDEKVYDLAVVPGMGDFHNPTFDVSVTPENECSQSDYLGVCENLDEALSLLFSYWRSHDMDCYANGYYKLDYPKERNPQGYPRILVDMGSSCYHGTILVQY